jgi:wyosine [tRNA(Phe)-imidazoG37] synthetase (radical SAM superfamily)
VTIAQLVDELKLAQKVTADYITFSGMGEPTLASNLGQAITTAKSILSLPVAVLTNSSLMPRDDVRAELATADVVIASVDASTQELFHKINRPVIDYSLNQILRGIKLFKEGYQGKLALEMMFVAANKAHAEEMAELAKSLGPDEVQINTPLRPCAVKPLTPKEIAAIKEWFEGLPAITIYEAQRPKVSPLNLKETLRRRPKL